MEFNRERPIYLQIYDWVTEKILRGQWEGEQRIDSARELAVNLQVNPNTVMRAYDYLQQKQIIYNKRGIGFFVSADAYDRIVEEGREEFMREQLPRIFSRMELLGVTPDELVKSFTTLKNDNK